ncbi:hypothetical protein ACS0TY_018897 [Phlomoides rotata]
MEVTLKIKHIGAPPPRFKPLMDQEMPRVKGLKDKKKKHKQYRGSTNRNGVFAAAFTVPGGVSSETGIPIFYGEPAFILFSSTNAVSLFTSITSLMMFLSILTSRYAEGDFLHVLPQRLSFGLLSLFISITFMLVAFSAALYLFPLLVDVVYSTYNPGIFGKKTDLKHTRKSFAAGLVDIWIMAECLSASIALQFLQLKSFGLSDIFSVEFGPTWAE